MAINKRNPFFPRSGAVYGVRIGKNESTSTVGYYHKVSIIAEKLTYRYYFYYYYYYRYYYIINQT